MKVLVLSPIADSALQRLRELYSVRAVFLESSDLRGDSVWHESEAEVVILRSGVELNHERLARMPHLRAVIRAGSGTDNIDVTSLALRGIPLITVTGMNIEAVAELTFGLFLTLARRIVLADRLLREGRWDKYKLMGVELRGKTLGVLGLGRTGTRVAELGLAWGMKAIGTVQRFSKHRAKEFTRKGIELMEEPLAVANESDFISINVPLTADTDGFVGANFIERMKPTAYLVNIARGRVVDSGVLKDALESGRIAGAGLDVHLQESGMSPFCTLPNVVLTPHIGSCTAETQEAIGNEILASVARFDDK